MGALLALTSNLPKSSTASTAFPDGKDVFVASGATIVRTGGDHCMSPCDHEEVDTIIVVHLRDVPESGCTTCLVRTVNADIVAILIVKYTSLVTKYKSTDLGLRLSAHDAIPSAPLLSFMTRPITWNL